MQPNTLTALFVATLCLAPNLARDLSAQTTSIPVTVTFRDSATDAVKSDGGPYVHTSPSLTSQINGNTGDLTLYLNSSKKPARYLRMSLSYNLGNLFGEVCPLSPAITWPSGEFLAQPEVVVFDLRSVPIDQLGTYLRAIAFSPTGYGSVRLGSKSNNPDFSFCSGKVLVSHPDANTWYIESAPLTNPIPSGDGIAVVVQDFSKTAQTDPRPVAYVKLPFRITVTRQ